jgi:hypothetical protein
MSGSGQVNKFKKGFPKIRSAVTRRVTSTDFWEKGATAEGKRF